jgi:hypothetical protein
MSAGLPGIGLGGIFLVISALVAPFVELVRTARGESSSAAWRGVGRQVAIALVMIVVLALSLRGGLLAMHAIGLVGAPDGRLWLPLTPLGITGALLAAVLGGAKVAQLVLAARDRTRRRRERTERRSQRLHPEAGRDWAFEQAD